MAVLLRCGHAQREKLLPQPCQKKKCASTFKVDSLKFISLDGLYRAGRAKQRGANNKCRSFAMRASRATTLSPLLTKINQVRMKPAAQ